MSALDAQQFLALLHGHDATIFFQVGSKTWKNKPQTFCQAEKTLRWRNAQGEGICFLVNTGGTKDAQIVRFNAAFIDWDCGRNPEGRYWNLEYVKAAKKRFLEILTAFRPVPSIVVETRNGFHAYWLLQGDVTATEFRDCQARLAKFFGSDPKVSNPARAMRLPGFNWVKPNSGCEPFPVRVVSACSARYRVEDIVHHLPAVAVDAPKECDRQSEGTKGCVGFGAHNKCKSSSTLALIVGAYPAKQPITPSEATFSNIQEAIDYLKEQDLIQYLGHSPAPHTTQGTTIRCPFHVDKTASGSVYRNSSTGHWFFKCHSTNCGIAGTIIDVARHLNGFPDEATTLRHLFDHYRITINSGWKEKQVALLDANITVLNDLGVRREDFPNLYRVLGRIRHDLISKLCWFRDHVESEKLRIGDDAIFFASLRQFHRLAANKDEHPKYFNRQNEKVDRYCLLGLLRKISDHDLPGEILVEARKRQRQSGHAYRIQFYCVPAYTDDVLQRADNRARVLIGAGASVRGISRELVLDLFGDEVAAEMYPQRSLPRPGVGDFADRLTAILIAQIESDGYATISSLRLALRDESTWKSVTERRIEKALPGILIRNRLRKMTCNGPLKAALGINARGYPKVIVA